MLGGFINSVRALMGLTIQIVPSDEDYSIASSIGQESKF